MNRENMDNDDRRRLEEKRRQRLERMDRRREAQEKKRPRLERNAIAIVGLIVSCNAFILSFTGWFVWLALIGLVLCGIGLLPNRPKNIKKYLALLGLGLAAVAVVNAVRVSNTWTVDDSALSSTYESEEIQESSETESVQEAE